MAVKTITIDLEAYDLLARHKKRGQSFSQVVKAHFGAVPTGRDLAAALDRLNPAPGTIRGIEAEVRERRRHRARIVNL
jgi:predicted CopG family antitoxin